MKWKIAFFLYFLVSLIFLEFIEVETFLINKNYVKDHTWSFVLYLTNRVLKFIDTTIMLILCLYHLRFYTKKLIDMKLRQGLALNRTNKFAIALAFFVSTFWYIIKDSRLAISIIITIMGD